MSLIRVSFLSTRKKAPPNLVKRKAINAFTPITYSCKVKVVPEKSLRLAIRVTVADTVETAANPAVPCFLLSLSTEHASLRRDLLEDVLFTTIGMQVLFCVAPMHPNYEA